MYWQATMRGLTLFSCLAIGLLAACRTNGTAPDTAPAPASQPVGAAVPVNAPAVNAGANAKVTMTVTEEGFIPGRIPAKKGQPIVLAITRTTDRTCARDIVFQGQDGKTPLPLNKTVEVTYTPRASGELKFGCAMGMMVSGGLAVSE